MTDAWGVGQWFAEHGVCWIIGLVGKAGKLGGGRRHSEEKTWVTGQEPRGRRSNHDVYVANRSRGEGMSKGNVALYCRFT